MDHPKAMSTGKRFFMSFRVSDPQIYEFTICFTTQSPISGQTVDPRVQLGNSELHTYVWGQYENRTPRELADFHFEQRFSA